MKSRIVKNIFPFWLLILLFGSCKKDFLTFKAQRYLEENEAITSVANTRSAINGLYSLMANTDNYGRSAVLIPELFADNLVHSTQRGPRYTLYDNYFISSGEGNAQSLWDNLNRLILNANTVILQAPSINVPSADSIEMRQLIGEAYAIRCMAIFDLARFFCQPFNYTTDSSHMGVPFSLSAFPKDRADIQYPSRGTIADTYQQILKDKDSALAYLPAQAAVIIKQNVDATMFKNRLNALSVTALAARIYLYKEDWNNAELCATQVINSGKYSLLPAENVVSGFYVQNNAESIFELANNQTTNQGFNSIAYIFNQKGYGEILATRDAYDTLFGFGDIDPRRGFMTIGNRNAFGGETNVPIVNKYNNITTYNENIKLIRLPEMYLIRAEARVNLGTAKRPLGLQDLQTIITARRSITIMPTTTTSLRTTVLRILAERRKELMFEGHRLFDLSRTKTSFYKYTARGVRYFNSATSSADVNDRILPISIVDMRTNPNLSGQQNPGY